MPISLLLTCALLFASNHLQSAPLKIRYPVERLPCYLCIQDKSLWEVMRQHFKLKSAENDPLVRRYIFWYQKNPQSLYTAIERSKLTMHFILSTTITNDLPAELALLPFVESHNDPFAHSAAGASGLWQMMPSIASSQQMTINHLQDDRRCIIKSTYNALTHLQYLHRVFHGNWEHAITAYNAGEGRIKKALKQQNSSKKAIWNHNLNTETKQYLPKLLALQAIIKNPKKYGFTLEPLANAPAFTPIILKQPYAFPQIAEICDVPEETLRTLNPSWRRVSTASHEEYIFLLPADKAKVCESKLKRKNPIQTKNWQQHRVKKGDNISNLAKKYHTSEENILSINQIGKTIHPNQILNIPKNTMEAIPTASTAKKSAIIQADSLPGPKQVLHTVLPTETLSSIAKKYHVSTEKIKSWNQLSNKATIQPTQTLLIWTKDNSKKQTNYTIQAGDNLSKLAKKFHTSIAKLRQANKLKSDILKIGQKILIR